MEYAPQPSRAVTIIKILITCGILIVLLIQILPHIPYVSDTYKKLATAQAKPKTATKTDIQLPQEDSREPPMPSPTEDAHTSQSYCYVGEWDGKRTCVGVSSVTDCVSRQVFRNKRDCV